jgi:uncharacterized protein (TIGR00106 family)
MALTGYIYDIMMQYGFNTQEYVIYRRERSNYFNVVSQMVSMSLRVQPLIHAEISVIPIVSGRDNNNTGMSKYIAKAFDAIRGIEGINAVLTAMGTQIESSDFQNILKAINATHDSLRKEEDIKRIISTIRIDERRDKSATLDDRVQSVQDQL